MRCDTPLEHIKGVGSKTAEALAKARLHTVDDLINFLPRTYEDFSRITPIAQLRPGKVSVKGTFSHIQTKRVRRGISVTEAVLSDDTSKVQVVWFNQGYRATQLEAGKEFLVSGEFGLQRQRYQIVNPSCELLQREELPITNPPSVTGQSYRNEDTPKSRSPTPRLTGVSGGRIVPLYRAVYGLKSQLVRKLLIAVRPAILGLPETLPEQILRRFHLMSRADALEAMHFPTSFEQLQAAKYRLGFEEVFVLMLASQLNKQDNNRLESHDISFRPADAKVFVEKLPFELTNAQRVAAWEAIKDMGIARVKSQESQGKKKTSPQPMNRLLQGDVGSGKTVVAGLVAYIAARAGFQTAFMAPTELLALQHADTLSRLLEPFDMRVSLLVGSIKASLRPPLYEAIKTGETDVVVGTHALFQDTVEFKNLGFVVIDEQHRFGVEQRQRLLAKSHRMPHLLAMTATPIPRSLQLTIYGELDISLLAEKPKNRKPIETTIISPNSRAQMYEKIDAEITAGRQAYVICPRIQDGQDEQKSVEAELKRLQNSIFKHRQLGLLHGKLTAQQKDEIMSAFAAGTIDILVSTTVVEVGVDVPNATVIVIEGADTFGLAQLHQLRGRVGRSDLQSYCYLVPSTSKAPSRRLRELEKSNDGFYLAERDLELRGPGEIYGRAQSGALSLRVANIADTKLLREAKQAAEWWLVNDGDLLQYKRLNAEVERYRRLTTLN